MNQKQKMVAGLMDKLIDTMKHRSRQTKLFRCPKCMATYLHDQAYQHQLFQCPKQAGMSIDEKRNGHA